MFRSIRWTLLFWYALILISALALFGWVLHDEMERAMYRGADHEIAYWLGTLERDLKASGSQSLGAALPESARFAVWDPDGLLVTSTEGRDHTRPRRAATSTRNDLRARAMHAAQGNWLWAAKDVSAEHARVRRFLRVLLVSGIGILALALGGGWFLVSRALRPIDRMAATAERISSDNLAERVDTASIQNELGRLAQTLNRTFDRLEGAFERQTRFTADASHELRTPLTILLSHLELAERKDRTPQEFSARIDTCLNAARRMRSVVESLLTLARVDAGQVEFERESVDLNDLVSETSALLAPLAEERGITLSSHPLPLHKGASTVQGDRALLRTAINNLVTNAIYYNSAGGRVDVSLHPDGTDAVIVVADTGEGIPEDALEHIFERFYRVDETRSGERSGSGLGLAITQWIARAHGGSIRVTSTLGVGTEMELRIPARK